MRVQGKKFVLFYVARMRLSSFRVSLDSLLRDKLTYTLKMVFFFII